MQIADILGIAGLRIDGRRGNEIRKLKTKLNVENTADGSCYLEQGLNKVLVLVHGPHEPSRRSSEQNEVAIVSCHVINAGFSGSDRKTRKLTDRRTVEMENVLQQTLESVIMLNVYPRSQIDIVIHILESDGSVLCTTFNAINMALMNAGIAMSDMIVSCSAGFVKNQLCVDLNQMEQSASTAFIPLAIKSKSEEILYFQLDSRLSQERLQQVLYESIEACREISQFMENSIKEYIVEKCERME